jgi:serine/threonine protein kinase
MNASNDEPSQTSLSTDQLESIALDVLAAPHIAGSDPTYSRTGENVHVALAKHPNICMPSNADAAEISQLHRTATYIDNRQIDDYCDREKLDIPARLQMFAQICRAVHFAHRHAVIHGGLSASNIVVTPDGVPKVTGFGAFQSGCLEALTQDEHVGTDVASMAPAQTAARTTTQCISPEQLVGEPVTTATDIYALGVVLYQLLTGRSPYRTKSNSRADLNQAVFEQAPEKPSSVVIRCEPEPMAPPLGIQPPSGEKPLVEPVSDFVARSGSAPPIPAIQEIAAARGCSPKHLQRILAGDVDAIVLTALRTEPERRYASAEQFAEDVDRYLAGRPVRARGSSTLYRCARSLKRHPVVVTGVVLLSLAVVTTAASVVQSLVNARSQQDRAERSSAAAREAIDELFARVSNDPLLDQPGFFPLRAALLENIWRFYRTDLDLQRSDRLLDPESIEARSKLARIASIVGPPGEAVSRYREAVALWDQLVSAHPTNRDYQARLAVTLADYAAVLIPIPDRLDEADRLLGRALRLLDSRNATERQPVFVRHELTQILASMAKIRAQQHRPDEAIELLDRVLETESQLAAENPRRLEPALALAAAHAAAGRIFAAEASELPKAMASYRRSSELYEAIVREHPELIEETYQLASISKDLSELQQRAGQLDLALQNLQRSRSIFERLNQSYPDVFVYRRGLGSVYAMMADLQVKRAETADAQVFAQKARVVLERLASERPQDRDLRSDLAESYSKLGSQFEQTGQSDKALQSLQRAIDLYESLPDLDPRLAYKLACNISRCIPLIATKSQPTDRGAAGLKPSNPDRLRQRLYGDRAIAALRRAVHTGRFTAEILETDKDLDPLHERSDFRDLIKELEKDPAVSGN